MSSSAASSDIVHGTRTGMMTGDNLMSQLFWYGPKIPGKGATSEDKAKFLAFFPGIYSLEDIDTPIETVLAMTGGKWAFPDIAIPEVVVNKFPTSQPGFWRNVREFCKECPELLGRPATYSDVFWVLFSVWAREMQRCPKDLEWSKVCLTEKRSDPLFRMYVDIDLKEPAQMDKRAWGSFVNKVCNCVARAVAGCYPSIDKKDECLRMTVLVAKDFLKRAEGGFKRGLHFVWPNLVVDQPTAISLVSHVELMLTRRGPARNTTQGQNSYENAVDTSVYRTGLRLPCCPKSVKCTCYKYGFMLTPDKCKETAATRYAQKARICPRHRDYPTGVDFHLESSYHLTGIFDGDGSSVSAEVFEHLVSSAYKYKPVNKPSNVYDFTLRELASIRTTATETTPGFKGQAEVEKLLAQVRPDDERLQGYDEDKPRKRSKIANRRLITPLEEAKKSTAFRKDHEVALTPDLLDQVQRIIRRFHPHYKNLVIHTPIAYNSTAQKQAVMPNGQKVTHRKVRFSSTSTFCMLKGAHHSSNTVTFHVHPNYVVQGCWSPNVHNGRYCFKTTSEVVDQILHIEDPQDLEAIHRLLNAPIMSQVKTES